MIDSGKASDSLKEFLMPFYQERLRKNPRYSLKKFAIDLGISSGRLSTLMNSENIPTERVVERIRQSLNLTPNQHKQFIATIELLKAGRVQESADVLIGNRDIDLVVDWLPFAILSLMKTRDFVMDSVFIADRLGVSPEQVDLVIQRLKSTDVLVYRDNAWCARGRRIATPAGQSDVIRASHLKKLELATPKLVELPKELRDFSSITFPGNSENLEKVRKQLIKFRRNIAELMQQGAADQVYSLNIQLFPLSKEVQRDK